MTRRKKLGLALLVLVVLSQVPFAYRRYQLGQLHSAIQQINSQRSQSPNQSYSDYKGVMHVHSRLGGHSPGTLEEIVAAARTNQLNFVVMTEHPSADVNTAAATLKGMHDGVLFINGNEVVAKGSERLFVIPGDESATKQSDEAAATVIGNAHSRNALAVVAYPDDFKSWSEPFDGVEIYNVYTNAREISPLIMFFDGLWSYRSYPDLLFAYFYERPSTALQKWDQLTTAGRKLAAVAGNDAHANIGLSLGSGSGEKFPVIQLDPYERSFQLVRMHVLVPQGTALTHEVLLAALRNGNGFIAFDVFGDATGFTFLAGNGRDECIQGGEITLNENLKLSVTTPFQSRIVLFRNGQQLQEDVNVTARDYRVTEKGVYRVEVYLPQLPTRVANQPWIISNPIYVR